MATQPSPSPWRTEARSNRPTAPCAMNRRCLISASTLPRARPTERKAARRWGVL